MSDITLGIIGGGQLGSMLAISAKKLNIKTVIYSDDPDAPVQNFCNKFISGDYNNKEKIIEFVNLVNYVTYEFENIPFETLNEINKLKPVLPKPSVNRLIQHRLAEKDFVNNLNIRTTRYASVENKSEIEALEDLLPGILKTTTLGYDGKGQYPINSIEEFNRLNIDYSKGYILEKSIFNEFNSCKEFTGYCPLPSYPSVVVFNIPGKRSSRASISDMFSIEAYLVVLIFNLFTKSFSANLC